MKQSESKKDRRGTDGYAAVRTPDTGFNLRMFWSALRGMFTTRGILFSLLTLLLCAFAGVLLLCGVYLLPAEPMEAHMPATAEIFAREGAYPLISRRWATSYLDNTTDSVMFMEASDKSALPTLQRALLVPRGKFASASEDPNGKDDSILDPVGRYMLGLSFSCVTSYPRYWHGYLLYVKPLLALTHYGNMRILNGVIQVLLVLLLFWRMAKKNRRELILPWLLMYLLLMPLSLAKSFQFSSCFYILLLSSHACLSAGQDRDRLTGLFLYAGIATAYFDFLTYPAATFGVPAILALSLMRGETAEEKLAFLVRAGLGWCFGYAGMWALKWGIASLLTDENVILDAWNNIRLRTSHAMPGNAPAISTASCLRMVTVGFFRSPLAVPAALYAAVMIFRLVRRRRTWEKEGLRIVLPYLLVGLLPFVWFCLTVNHSYVHYYFTCRALCVSILALLVCLAELCRASDNAPVTQK